MQVALTGLRRRRGIEGLSETDTQLSTDLVNELLLPSDETWEILQR